VSKKKHRKRLRFSPKQPICISDELVRLGLSIVPCIAPSAESARSTSKVEGKDSQLPVTDPALEIRPGFVQLFSPLDPKKNAYFFLWWITEREARQYLRNREVVQLHFTRKHIRSVHLIEKQAPAVSPDSASADPPDKKPSSLRKKGMGDSHDHDTEFNPAGVWTINYLPKSKWTRKIFLAVPISCLQRAA
jgi:hypothetical protein